MARHPRAFTDLSRSIVRAGGEGGFLEEALERIAKFTDQQAELKSRVMGALAYPIFLAVFGVTIVTVLVIFFVPKFEDLFAAAARPRRVAGADRVAAVDQRRRFINYGLLIALAIAGLVLLRPAAAA